ncbi:ADP-ribose pyrophosphatase YjhB (NUDIX family) [Bacillus mesophilus]|uniref:NUDIX hydrolase n=1 Tax=Bacillus mesophilus TaxID=1808955 RepID=A0A6M0Q6X2_9BACI|nr:ADP-ribose pyrophosphatase YjhB (NUDIX family) [Bacillus mesophilus]NEY72085.1 NUDIX hydrolase [Bacillus mesophilus]
MGEHKRGNVWLAVAGLVVNSAGEWLVVKKKYGGLKGKWSIPAGFVEENETVDQAVIREVLEETGISCQVQGILGIRSGVIKDKISDNMIIFSLKMNDDGVQTIITQEDELYEATFKSPEELKNDEKTSVLLRYYMEMQENQLTSMNEDINPGDQFGYTSYKLFY